MSNIIQDGTGNCYTVKVNSKNRLFTNAVILEDNDMSALEGKAFIANTAEINLTSGNASAIMYFKNEDAEKIVTNRFSLSTTDSTNGTGKILFEIIRNPTATNAANSLDFINRDFGSSLIVDSNPLGGAEGKTFTGGEVLSRTYFSAGTSILASISFVFNKGDSIGFRVTPPSGNTSMNVIAGLNIHKDGFNQ